MYIWGIILLTSLNMPGIMRNACESGCGESSQCIREARNCGDQNEDRNYLILDILVWMEFGFEYLWNMNIFNKILNGIWFRSLQSCELVIFATFILRSRVKKYVPAKSFRAYKCWKLYLTSMYDFITGVQPRAAVRADRNPDRKGGLFFVTVWAPTVFVTIWLDLGHTTLKMTNVPSRKITNGNESQSFRLTIFPATNLHFASFCGISQPAMFDDIEEYSGGGARIPSL